MHKKFITENEVNLVKGIIYNILAYIFEFELFWCHAIFILLPPYPFLIFHEHRFVINQELPNAFTETL